MKITHILIDAINEFRGIWPLDERDVMTFDLIHGFSNKGSADQIVCTYEEFMEAVSDLNYWVNHKIVPPKNTVCEFSLGDSDIWYECSIKESCGSHGAIIYCNTCEKGEQYVSTKRGQPVKFRPIKRKSYKPASVCKLVFYSDSGDVYAMEKPVSKKEAKQILDILGCKVENTHKSAGDIKQMSQEYWK